MKNKNQIRHEIKKLRKVLLAKTSTESEKDKAWCCMLTLQWLYLKDNLITPTSIVAPRIVFHRRSIK